MTYIIAIALIILAVLIAYFFRFIIGKIFDAFGYLNHTPKNSNNELSSPNYRKSSTTSKDMANNNYNDFNENFQNAREKVNSILNNPKADINKESPDENLENHINYLNQGVPNQKELSSYEEMWEIAGQYGGSIPTKSTMPGIYPNSILPYSREEIKHALATLLLIENNPASSEIICMNYTTLDKFVPDDIYSILANTFGEPDSADTQQDYEKMAEMSLNKVLSDKNGEFIQVLDSTTNFLKEREYNTTIELIALRRIAGLDVEFYLMRLKDLADKKKK